MTFISIVFSVNATYFKPPTTFFLTNFYLMPIIVKKLKQYIISPMLDSQSSINIIIIVDMIIDYKESTRKIII